MCEGGALKYLCMRVCKHTRCQKHVGFRGVYKRCVAFFAGPEDAKKKRRRVMLCVCVHAREAHTLKHTWFLYLSSFVKHLFVPGDPRLDTRQAKRRSKHTGVKTLFFSFKRARAAAARVFDTMPHLFVCFNAVHLCFLPAAPSLLRPACCVACLCTRTAAPPPGRERPAESERRAETPSPPWRL